MAPMPWHPTLAEPVSGARVLLVEDDAALVELLVWHLTREGYEVEHTGELAVTTKEQRDAAVAAASRADK